MATARAAKTATAMVVDGERMKAAVRARAAPTAERRPRRLICAAIIRRVGRGQQTAEREAA